MVIVSRDVLIYEVPIYRYRVFQNCILQVINGLMSRSDWETAINFPIGCIPGGSGNALCLNINYLAGYVQIEGKINFFYKATPLITV